MICPSCRKAADQSQPELHSACEWPASCSCQHREGEDSSEKAIVDAGPVNYIWERYKKYEDCPVCAAPTGEPCIDLRSPPSWRRTLKPHKKRNRLTYLRSGKGHS